MTVRSRLPQLVMTGVLISGWGLAPGQPAHARAPEAAEPAVDSAVEPAAARAAVGTVEMLGDLAPGATASMPRFPHTEFRSANGRVFFASDDGVHGLEPWVTDGTPQGTVLVGDLQPGAADSDPAYFTSAPHGVVFMTDTRLSRHGPLTGAIWSTTATGTGHNAGTTTRLAQGRDVVSIDAVAFNGAALLATSDFDRNAQVWRSDGTVAGTFPLKQHLILPDDLTPIGGLALFLDGQNPMWRTDGTSAGTRKLITIGGNFGSSTFLMELTAVGRRAFFRVDTLTDVGTELWVSDGTRRGTRLVRDIRPGPASSSPRKLTAHDDDLLFLANDGVHGLQVWRTDRNGRRTVRLTDVRAERLSRPVQCGSTVYFTAKDRRGRELWARSGHRVRRVVDLLPGRGSSSPHQLTCVGETLAFVASDGSHGRELWTLDGPGLPPVLHDLSPSSSYPTALVALDGDLYFVATDGVHGREPWVLHGVP
jgi:ELWxxDGT repeat protein